MIGKEQNELMTRIGPGTPAGKLLRRYWQPVAPRLRADDALKKGPGETFVDYYCRIKEAEIARFNSEVSEWEHREYFDLF